MIDMEKSIQYDFSINVISITSLLHENAKYTDVVLSANFAQLSKMGRNTDDFWMMPAFIES